MAGRAGRAHTDGMGVDFGSVRAAFGSGEHLAVLIPFAELISTFLSGGFTMAQTFARFGGARAEVAWHGGFTLIRELPFGSSLFRTAVFDCSADFVHTGRGESRERVNPMVICTAQYSTHINSAMCTLHWEHPGGQRSSVLGQRDRRNAYRGNGRRLQRREGCLGYRREPNSARVLPNVKVDLICGTFCTLATVRRRRSRNDLLQLVRTPALCIPDTSDRHVYFP